MKSVAKKSGDSVGCEWPVDFTKPELVYCGKEAVGLNPGGVYPVCKKHDEMLRRTYGMAARVEA